MRKARSKQGLGAAFHDGPSMACESTLPEKIAKEKGSYVIVAELALDTRLEVGRLGTLDFKAGFYAYAGSARGPGGLAARIGHHLKMSRKPHWHMDYLRRHAEIVETWFCLANQSCEHAFAEILGRSTARPTAVVGFGCSDCKCPAHLYRFDATPDFDAFEKQWNSNTRGGASRLKRVWFF